VAAVIPPDPEDVEDFLLAHNPKIQTAVRQGIEDAKAGRVYEVAELLKEAEQELKE
jgi:predicted transcriptional regulator